MIELKIAIPTYNRPEHIKRQVCDLLPQLREGVSLIVYDNCSDIPVASYFTQEELSQFTLVRNKFNIGGAANIGKCLTENGDSGWIWLLGDDDRIIDNAVDVILNTIQSHQDCCYINFQQKKTEETKCFLDFLNYMKIIGAFGISFFQSACLFNMDKLRPYVMYYYEFLTLWVGQVALVIKYLSDNPHEHCFFTTTRIITECTPGGWEKSDFIIRFPIMIDLFQNQKYIMKPTLFKGLGDMYFTILSQEKWGVRRQLYFINYISSKLGWVNIFRYNKVTFIEYLLAKLCPNGIYKFIRKRYANSYNNSLKK